MENQLLDINELAEYLHVKKATIADWVYHKRIPYLKLGRCLRFRKDLIDMWIENSLHIPLQMKILYNNNLNNLKRLGL